MIVMGIFYWTIPLIVRGIAVDAMMILYGIGIFSFILAGMSQKRFKILRQTERFSVKIKERKIHRMQRREKRRNK